MQIELAQFISQATLFSRKNILIVDLTQGVRLREGVPNCRHLTCSLNGGERVGENTSFNSFFYLQKSSKRGRCVPSYFPFWRTSTHTHKHTRTKRIQMYTHSGNYLQIWLDGITLLAWTVLLAEPAVSHRAFDVITVADWWLCGTDHKFRRLPQPQCDASTSVCTSNTSRSGCTAQFWRGVAGRDRRRDHTWRVQAVPMILMGCNIASPSTCLMYFAF